MKYHDPITILEILSKEPDVFLLDSAANKATGRFSYLGFSPAEVIKAKSFDQLRQAKIKLPAIGTISYDNTMRFGLYDVIICFDHVSKKLTIKNFGNKAKALQVEDFLNDQLSAKVVKSKTPPVSLTLKPSMTRLQYQDVVKKALKHIHDGNIYQINLTYAQKATLTHALEFNQVVSVYKELRQTSPTNLCAFLRAENDYILSSSPERFCSLDKNKAVLVPMKGTRPRGKNKLTDQQHHHELWQSNKERAELLMVTDLARNDLGRVCQTGTVKVKTLRAIERYKKVFQATATVEGRLKKGKGIVDLLEATFPGGSITGCPKLSAIDIIKKLETTKRGLYTGALGYFNMNNKADFSMLIRSIFITPKEVRFHVGSGIVADSNPKAEYDETLLKAQGMMEALHKGLKA